MNLFDLRPENEELVLRRIEVFLSRKLKKKYPKLLDLSEQKAQAFAQDEKTIVTQAKGFQAHASTIVQDQTKPKRSLREKKPTAWQQKLAVCGFFAFVALILWLMLF